MKLHNDQQAHELVLKGGTILFSYETPVACYSKGTGYVRMKYSGEGTSSTTRRHIKAFGISNCEPEYTLKEEAFTAKLNEILLNSAEVPNDA